MRRAYRQAAGATSARLSLTSWARRSSITSPRLPSTTGRVRRCHTSRADRVDHRRVGARSSPAWNGRLPRPSLSLARSLPLGSSRPGAARRSKCRAERRFSRRHASRNGHLHIARSELGAREPLSGYCTGSAPHRIQGKSSSSAVLAQWSGGDACRTPMMFPAHRDVQLWQNNVGSQRRACVRTVAALANRNRTPPDMRKAQKSADLRETLPSQAAAVRRYH
jgi:hypothetical protein